MKKASIWGVVPAAGIGQRMQSEIPKQYLPLAGSSVLEITLNKLLSVKQLKGLVVALQADDPYWPRLHIDTDKPLLTATGGAQRSDSVLSALTLLSQHNDFDFERDWVMVHDAARPCVSLSDVDKLIEKVMDPDRTETGGLLAVPVRDTMKRQTPQGGVARTEERDGLWHALTPQLFPCKSLHKALLHALNNAMPVTDESSAMELQGVSPMLVQGRDENIKITRPADLRLAELYLAEQYEKENVTNG